jgi:hypothetical protein
VIGDVIADVIGGFLTSGVGSPYPPRNRDRILAGLLVLVLLAGAVWLWLAGPAILAWMVAGLAFVIVAAVAVDLARFGSNP